MKKSLKKEPECEYEGCFIRPSFNIPTELKGRFCAKHQLNGMTNVKSKKCLEFGCCKQPVYNYPGKKIGLWCFDHRDATMINVNNLCP